MKILLIDIDSVKPNLALMRISGYYKSLGHNVTLKKCNISYYPSGNRKLATLETYGYDKTFVAAIFPGTRERVNIIGKVSDEGGTGVDITKQLPEEMKFFDPDYSLYGEKECSYGFITRGCIRRCYFCFVPEKEGKLRFEQHPREIIKHNHNKVQFMDNNIFAYNKANEILKWLAESGVKYQFNQATDIRLLDQEKAELLHASNYWKPFTFALDDLVVRKEADRGLEVLEKAGNIKWPAVRFFVYCNPNHDIASDVVKRIEWCRDRDCMVYLMRDISCFYDKNARFYNDLAAWCNQPGFFKKQSFQEFLSSYHNRIRDKYQCKLFKFKTKKEQLIELHTNLYTGK